MTDAAAERQALADKIRGEHTRSTRRRRNVAVIVVLVGLLVGAAVFVWFQMLPKTDDTAIAEPANASPGYGFALTPELVGAVAAEPTTPVALYEDFLCPSCKIFHEQTGAWLTDQVAAGRITVTYHPFAFLLTQSTDEYAQRAANAAVCVADDAGVPAYVAMHGLLLTNQPAQGGPGLTDEQLIAFATEAGAGDVTTCVTERTFTPWVERALEAGLAADVHATPTVRVGGLNVVRSDDGQETMPGIDELDFAIGAVR